MTTLREAMAQAVATLRRAGLPDPQADVRRLMAHALGTPPERLALIPDRALTPDEAARFDALVARRKTRQPVAQITGHRAFWKHDFRVTPDTLDPRPETEILVEQALRLPWTSVLDLGTGTGAILISLLAERKGARGLGTDISPAALQVAQSNAAALGVAADFALSDWFAGVSGRFDLIVSNPPYIAAAEMAGLSPEVRDWEPHAALTDGADGLTAYRAIAAGAGAHLSPGGAVLVEIGPAQAADVTAIFAAAGAQGQVIHDLDGRDRVIFARFVA